MKLIALDGDDTLWQTVSGVNLSDRTPTDDEGWPRFTYSRTPNDPLVIERDDGALFRLRPEAREVLQQLRSRGLLTGVVSYNHEGNIRRALEAFGVSDLVDFVVAEWHTNKDRMLNELIALARRDGHDVRAQDVMLVDDDPNDIYSGQCRRMGAGFCRFGVDMHDLREVLELVGKRET
jgi:magnesium-dependent phosphatase-1